MPISTVGLDLDSVIKNNERKLIEFFDGDAHLQDPKQAHMLLEDHIALLKKVKRQFRDTSLILQLQDAAQHYLWLHEEAKTQVHTALTCK